MPWKGEKDPYKIWLSEIILQQTRVEQGLEYYNNFILTFPTIHDLANAPDQKVFKLWEGLGYYSRCKNLLATARIISQELKGEFPDNYEDIKALKGIGPYTASAISSFAFNLPYAVVDGNVYRVLSRYFGINTPVDTSDGKRIYNELATALLDKKQPGIYNQAIMDFGALICKPQQPLCSMCVQKMECEAFRHGVVNELPVKEKVLKKRTRWFYYFIIEWNNRFYIRKRSGKDIWENLYEFNLVERESAMNDDPKYLKKLAADISGSKATVNYVSGEYRQQLSHQIIIGRFITLTLQTPAKKLDEYEAVSVDELRNYAFPAFINNFLLEGYLPEKN